MRVCCAAALLAAAGASRVWEEVAVLADAKQPHGAYGGAVGVGEGHAETRVFVGAKDGNAAKGLVRVVTEAAGFAETARLRSPSQRPLDGLGGALSVNPNGLEVVAGAAGVPGSPGYVSVFRHASSYGDAVSGGGRGKDCLVDPKDPLVTSDAFDPDWRLHQKLTLGDAEAKVKDQFGRAVELRGAFLAVSSVNRRSPQAERDTVKTVLQPGTRDYIESYAGETGQDTVRLFYRRTKRNDTEKFEPAGGLAAANSTAGRDFGAAIAFDQNGGLLGVTAPVRFDAVYGHGGSGDLVVPAGQTTVLDGGGEFHFKNVRVEGTLTVTRRDAASNRGGQLVMKVQNEFLVESSGVVTVDGLGYEGGPQGFRTGGHTDRARQGESTGLRGTIETSAPNLGGGGSGTSALVGASKCVYDGSAPMFPDHYTPPNSTTHEVGEACGGGGGYGTAGNNGTAVQCGDSGEGGEVHGSWADLDYGSGGGSGHPYAFGSGGSGGSGGGVINIIARTLINKGSISSNGNDGGAGGYFSGGGGGGSGGSIRLTGETLINNGTVEALGGAGGVRAVDSGSTGTNQVKGGDGGKGRIQYAFVTVPFAGTFDPTPNDATATLFVGSIHVFDHTPPTAAELAADAAATGVWQERVIATPDGAHYIGHSVAVHGDYVAFGSSQQLSDASLVSDASVFVVKKDGGGEYEAFQQLTPPDSSATTTFESAKFGETLAFFEHGGVVWLLVSSLGDNTRAGVLWIYKQAASNPFHWALDAWVHAATPAAADGFGGSFSLSFSRTHWTLYVLSAAHGLHAFQHQLPAPSAADSSLSCEYTDVTQGTPTTCTLSVRDADGRLVGFAEMVASLSVTSALSGFQASDLAIVSEGVFEFTFTPTAVGAFSVVVEHDGATLATASGLEAFAAVDPATVTFSCDETMEAGRTVTCTVTPAGGVGEESAAAAFVATVYNTDLEALSPPFDAMIDLSFYGGQQLAVHRYVTAEAAGGTHPHLADANYRVNPFDLDEPVSAMAWAMKGEYRFTFAAPDQGLYSVFLKYQDTPVGQHPNPFMVQVTAAAVDVASSSVSCVGELAPERVGSCVITLKGAQGARTGASGVVSDLSVTFEKAASPVTVDHHLVWGGIGKVRLWFAADAGDYTVKVAYQGDAIGAGAAVAVAAQQAAPVCQALPFPLSTYQILHAHFGSYSDVDVHDGKATAVEAGPKEYCEQGRV